MNWFKEKRKVEETEEEVFFTGDFELLYTNMINNGGSCDIYLQNDEYYSVGKIYKDGERRIMKWDFNKKTYDPLFSKNMYCLIIPESKMMTVVAKVKSEELPIKGSIKLTQQFDKVTGNMISTAEKIK